MKKRILITLLTFLLASCTKNNYNETNESENKTEGCVHKCPNCGLCYDKNCDNSNKCDCLSKNIFLSSVRYVSNDYDGGEKITFNPKENSYTYFEFEKENGVEYLHYIDTYYYEGDYLTKKTHFHNDYEGKYHGKDAVLSLKTENYFYSNELLSYIESSTIIYENFDLNKPKQSKMTRDLYFYNSANLLVKIEFYTKSVEDSDFSIDSKETFEYDDLGRITKDETYSYTNIDFRYKTYVYSYGENFVETYYSYNNESTTKDERFYDGCIETRNYYIDGKLISSSKLEYYTGTRLLKKYIVEDVRGFSVNGPYIEFVFSYEDNLVKVSKTGDGIFAIMTIDEIGVVRKIDFYSDSEIDYTCEFEYVIREDDPGFYLGECPNPQNYVLLFDFC